MNLKLTSRDGASTPAAFNYQLLETCKENSRGESYGLIEERLSATENRTMRVTTRRAVTTSKAGVTSVLMQIRIPAYAVVTDGAGAEVVAPTAKGEISMHVVLTIPQAIRQALTSGTQKQLSTALTQVNVVQLLLGNLLVNSGLRLDMPTMSMIGAAAVNATASLRALASTDDETAVSGDPASRIDLVFTQVSGSEVRGAFKNGGATYDKLTHPLAVLLQDIPCAGVPSQNILNTDNI